MYIAYQIERILEKIKLEYMNESNLVISKRCSNGVWMMEGGGGGLGVGMYL